MSGEPQEKKLKPETKETKAEQTVDAGTQTKILTQIDFYFGVANYPTDKFLLKTAAEHDGWVPIEVLKSFKRLAALSMDTAVIANAVLESDVVDVNEEKTAIRRKSTALPEDAEDRQVFTKTYPDDVTWEDISAFWNDKVGDVLATRLHRKSDKSFAGSAMVEFKSAEAAQKAIAAAADESLVFREGDDPLTVAPRKAKTPRKTEEKSADEAPKEISFVKGCIVVIDGLGIIPDRTQLKEALEPFGDVDYIDYSDDAIKGFCRFADPDAAQAALDAFAAGTREIFSKVPSLSLLEGEEEHDYWKAIIDRGNAKKKNRSSGGRGGRRGGKSFRGKRRRN